MSPGPRCAGRGVENGRRAGSASEAGPRAPRGRERFAAAADEAAGDVLAVERRKPRFVGERGKLAERVVQVVAAAAERDGGLACIQAWNAAGSAR